MARKITVCAKVELKINADDDITLSEIMACLDCNIDIDTADVEELEVIDYECVDSK